jgi:uncharacterized protein
MTIDWQAFNVTEAVSALSGGLLIGVAALWLAFINGKLAGISGIVSKLIESLTQRHKSAYGWQWVFLCGLLLAPNLWRQFGVLPPITQVTHGWGLLLGGVLVGLGTRLANGCTSGHGICGLSRLSLNSLVAVLCFMGSAMVTVYFTHHILVKS